MQLPKLTVYNKNELKQNLKSQNSKLNKKQWLQQKILKLQV
jgi:hypothetical protein